MNKERRKGSEGVDQHLVKILLDCAKGDVEYFYTTKPLNKETLLDFVNRLNDHNMKETISNNTCPRGDFKSVIGLLRDVGMSYQQISKQFKKMG